MLVVFLFTLLPPAILLFADPKPVVECSFITEFEDHTLVAMDAEVILFLHDLIASYIREKDKGTLTLFVAFIICLLNFILSVLFCFVAPFVHLIRSLFKHSYKIIYNCFFKSWSYYKLSEIN